MLLWLQRPPHREGWDASSSALYQAWWILLNRILRSEAETWSLIASPVFWPIVSGHHSLSTPTPHTEVEKLGFTK